MPKLKIAYQKELSKTMQQQLQQIEDTKWPDAQPDDANLLQFLYIDNGILVAHVGLDFQSYCMNGMTFRVAGVCGVITHHEHLHKGLASHLLKECICYMEEQGIDFSVFTCADDLVGFYKQFGWVKSDYSFIGGSDDRPFSPRDLGLFTMLYFHSSMPKKIQQALLNMDIFIPLGEHKLW